MTDREILDRIYSDDAEGLVLLIEVYADLVYKIVGDILYEINEKNTQECVADSFLAFYNNIDDVDLSRGSIKGYLGVIARRRAVNLYFTLCPDADDVFDEYNVEEMSDILEETEITENADISDTIIRLCLKEIAPGFLEEKMAEETAEDGYTDNEEDEPIAEKVKKKSSGLGRALKILAAMVTLVTVIAAAVIALDKFSSAEEAVATTEATTTTKAEPFNPLLSAITSGNEKLIEELIANSLLITDEVLRFAIESADKISYDSIRRIAEEVRNKYGSTGLDPILDSAIFGDFSSVEEKIRNKDESEMTPAEKLAKFFAETVGGQVG